MMGRGANQTDRELGTMGLQLRHTVDESLTALVDGQELFRYVYRSSVAQWETPKPFFHPLRTLAGRTVTIHRPHDHLWHHGLAMTLTVVNDQNFWGGNTYLRDQGYVALPNTGRQTPAGLPEICPGEAPSWTQPLDWITFDGQRWLAEQRTIALRVEADEGWYRLDFDIALSNVSGRPLTLGSPTTEGRDNAGYMGLMWRGPRDFTGGRLMMADGRAGKDDLMGERSPWLAFIGHHDEVTATSTLIFIDDASTPGHPIKWFCRSTPAMVAFAFCFDQELALAPGEGLRLRHAVVVADGDWTRERIEGLVQG